MGSLLRRLRREPSETDLFRASEAEQRWLCDHHGASFDLPSPDSLVAISPLVVGGHQHVAGVRYAMGDHMSGWIMYASDHHEEVADLTYEHAVHLATLRPDLLRYLALPVGWRFDAEPEGESVRRDEPDAEPDRGSPILDLQPVIDAAAASIGEDGELPYSVRLGIRAAVRSSGGHTAWTRLESAAAFKVRPVWTEAHPADDQPFDLLERALAAALTGRPLATDELDRVRADLGDKLYAADTGAFPAVYAGLAAWAAAATATIDPAPVAAQSELVIDPEDWHASFYASLAAASGATWEKDVGNSDLRRAFWLWYVDRVPDVSAGGNPDRSGSAP